MHYTNDNNPSASLDVLSGATDPVALQGRPTRLVKALVAETTASNSGDAEVSND